MAMAFQYLNAMYLHFKENLPPIPLLQPRSVQNNPKSWLDLVSPNNSTTLDAAGLVALADLSTIAHRTALTGTSTLLDTLIVAPGLHAQQRAPELNQAEFPACAALTSGYVFRVENAATVVYLKKVGRTGMLTTLEVTPCSSSSPSSSSSSSISKGLLTWATGKGTIWDFEGETLMGQLAYLTAIALTLTITTLMALLRDWWALAVLGILLMARGINILVIRRRAAAAGGWKGASEPGVNGDLLVLLSEDRWIRLQGAVDDLKAVTSGQWLREMSFLESAAVGLATLLVYCDAALAGSATQEGKLLLLVLMFGEVGLLGLSNEFMGVLRMQGRVVRVVGGGDGKGRRRFARRRDLADELIKETGRDDWAVRLGMVVKQGAEGEAEKTM